MSNNKDSMQRQTTPAHERYRVWLTQAKFDLEAARDSEHNEDYEWTCYQAVQSVEKALKSVIIHAGWRPPQTHKLGILLSMCNKANDFFLKVKFNYRKIEAYTFISRYPFVYPGQPNKSPHELINRQDAQTCIAVAEDIYNKVDEFLKSGVIHSGKDVDLSHLYFTSEEIEKRIQDVIFVLKNSDKMVLKKMILFGSFAREHTRPRTSTMDVLVIAETELSFIDRIEYVRDLTKDHEPIIEPLVYTPHEFDYMLKEQGEGFLESAIEEGRVVYTGE